MLTVLINKPQFEYDIHSLVRAFYPGEDVKVICAEEAPEAENSALPVIHLSFEEESVTMTLMVTTQNGAGSEFRVSRVEHASDAARVEIKNLVKQLIYKGLSKYLNKELPWGTLTGIRPTKIPMTMLEEDKTEAEIMDYMKDTYFISDEKGNLSIDIAKREKKLLSTLHYKDGYSISLLSKRNEE